MLKKNNILYLLLIFIAVLIGIVSLYISINKPMTMDEIDFFLEGLSVKNTGFPTINGFWHPPLYLFVLGNTLKITGGWSLTGKILGAFTYILTFFIIVLLIPKLVKKEQVKMTRIIFTIFYFLNPLIIQQSTLVDIDTSIFPLILALFIFVLFTMKNSFTKYLLMSLIFGLAVFTKFFPAPLIIVALLVFYFANKKSLKSLIPWALIGIAGVMIFVVSWIYISSAAEVSSTILLDSYTQRFADDSSLFSPIHQVRQIIYSLVYNLFWLSLPFFILLLFYLFNRIKKFLEKKKLENQDYLLLLGWLMFLSFNFLRPTGGGMKYQFSAYVLFTIIISIYVANILELKDKKLIISEKLRKNVFWGGTLLGILLVCSYFFINKKTMDLFVDKFLQANYFNIETFKNSFAFLPTALVLLGVLIVLSSLIIYYHSYFKMKEKKLKIMMIIMILVIFSYYLYLGDVLLEINNLNIYFWIIYLFPLILSTILILAFSKNLRIISIFLFSLMLVCWIATLFHQGTSDYNVAVSWNNYGEKGIYETVEYLKSKNLGEGELLSRIDIGFYVFLPENMKTDNRESDFLEFNINKNKYDNDNIFYLNNLLLNSDSVDKHYSYLLENRGIKFIQLDQYHPPFMVEKFIENDFELDRKIGDFYIYKRK